MNPGDTIWIVTVRPIGQLHLVGRLLVGVMKAYTVENRSKGHWEEYRIGYKKDWKVIHHVVAQEGTEEAICEVSLMDVAKKLRYARSPPHRERIRIQDDAVDEKQFRVVRELTLESAFWLEAVVPMRKHQPGSVPLQQETKKRLTPTPYEDFSSHEIYKMFGLFIPRGAEWTFHGHVPIPNSHGDFVFFVTLDDQMWIPVDITEKGVLVWQCHPHLRFSDKQIQQLIGHNHVENSIYLFLRARKDSKYTYLGPLKYLSHDTRRPVRLWWQILNFDSEKFNAKTGDVPTRSKRVRK